MKRTDTAFLRYWTKVIADGDCLIWQAATNSAGYGVVWWDRRLVLAHRWAYWLFKGAIPAEKIICHTCDVPTCVNPAHLIAGDHSRNLREAWYRKRRKYRPCTLTEV